jgi:signal transduction histidine kinase
MAFGTRWPFQPSPPIPPPGGSSGADPSPVFRRLRARLSAAALLLSATWLAFLIHYPYPIFPFLIVIVLAASLWGLRAGALCLLAALAVLAVTIIHVAAHPWRDGWDDLLALTLLGLFCLAARSVLDGVERQRLREQQLNAELSEAVAQLKESQQQQQMAHEQLLRSARLAALGQFSATMAHELRNPLNVIKLSMHYVNTRVPAQDEKLQRNLSHMNRSVDRACEIIDDMLAFARLPPPRPRLLAVNELVSVSIAALPVTEWVKVDGSLAPDLPLVMADAQQIEQAVTNLGLNALQAMPEGGCLSISTRREGEQIAITVCDTGPGIPEELRERVFEPFFSTKVTGTGLGLPLVREIALAHGGDLSLQSRPGEGACFLLLLPLAAALPCPDRLTLPSGSPSEDGSEERAIAR